MAGIKHKDDKHHYKPQASARKIDLKDSDNVVLHPAFVFPQKERSAFIHVGWPRDKYPHPIIVYVPVSEEGVWIPESTHLARDCNELFITCSAART